jgi:hypothetical protein
MAPKINNSLEKTKAQAQDLRPDLGLSTARRYR